MNEQSKSSRCYDAPWVARLNYKGNKKIVEVTRDLPTLPPCVTWHKGLKVDVGEELFTVKCVYFSVEPNGLEIYTDEKEYTGEWSDKEALAWAEYGWKVR